ncbi:zinc finger protein 888-like [Penaeus indicus]|uniref:zinc finger protein 888-like n=1 Tax=Penaeus indicus TaxID=29960 RepID=UPI00300C0B53
MPLLWSVIPSLWSAHKTHQNTYRGETLYVSSLSISGKQEIPCGRTLQTQTPAITTRCNLWIQVRVVGGENPSLVVERGRYTCNFCSRSTFKKEDMRRHLRTHTGEKPFICPHCPYRATQKAHVIAHIRRKHCAPVFVLPNTYESIKKESAKTIELDKIVGCDVLRQREVSTYLCPYCRSVSFMSMSDLRRHVRIHTGEKPYACPFCQYRAKRTTHLQDHMRRKHPSPISSENSAASSVPAANVEYDEWLQTVDRRTLTCPYCLRSTFRKQHDLKRHLRTHTGERPYQCPLCPHRAATEPLVCPYCHRSTFKQKSDLKRHIRRHTGEKPYQCPLCNYSAVRSDYVQDHMMRRHGQSSKGRKRISNQEWTIG